MKKKAFLSAGKAAHALGVSVKTIQRWDKAELLLVIRTATNQRRIPAAVIDSLPRERGSAPQCAIYARVSRAKQEQEDNVTRQADRLQTVAKERRYRVAAAIAEQASSLQREAPWHGEALASHREPDD